jgi:hypothetical protein
MKEPLRVIFQGPLEPSNRAAAARKRHSFCGFQYSRAQILNDLLWPLIGLGPKRMATLLA